MPNWDVIVVGLGGVGSATAYHLSRAGYQVLGLDPNPLAHDRGSSHGQSRVIRQAYFEHPSYVPMLQRAYELWHSLESETDRKLFDVTGIVEIGPADGIVIPGVLRSASEHQLDIEQLTMAEVTERWPGITGHPDWHAVVERNAGLLRVEDCVRSHAECAGRKGATLRHGVGVREWSARKHSVTVKTEHGNEQADRIVIAGGPWAPSLIGQCGSALQILRKQMYWLEPARPFASGARAFTADNGFPCFFHETETGFYYGFPMLDHRGIKVARHSGGQPVTQPEGDHPVDQDDARRVTDYVTNYLPAASRHVNQQVGCFYTMTPDEHFLIDRHPDSERVVIIAGLSGHGFKFTSVLGEIASQMATGATPPYDLSLFRIDRLLPGQR